MKTFFLIVLLSTITISAQSFEKKFIVKQQLKEDNELSDKFNRVEYKVKSQSNEHLYSILNEIEIDVPYSKLEVFNDSSSVLINSFYGTLTFFNNKGNYFTKVQIGKNISVDYERSIKSVTDNDKLLIVYKNQLQDQYIYRTYKNNGALEKEFVTDHKNINGIAFSENDNQIFVSHINWRNNGIPDKKLSLLDGNGKTLKTYNSNFEKGFFTKNQFIGFTNKNMISINTDNFELLFEKKTTGEELFLDLASNDNGSIVSISVKAPVLKNGKWYYQNPVIRKLNSAGDVIEDRIEVTEQFSDYNFVFKNEVLEFKVGKQTLEIN